ncbi:hypothetical protein [Actinokineospora enzanensis]|uniref:hypothetical protein n=1 Tax=Actinokineospora enzanensis TaxID=155975 RepID=UPI0012EBF7B1|nr:hypothetical protein [Actinokineospora enzanensis]
MDRAPLLPCPHPWRRTDGSPQESGKPAGNALTVDSEGAAGLLLPTRPTTIAAGVVLIVVGLGLMVPGGLLIASGHLMLGIAGGVLGLLGLLFLAAGIFALTRKQREVGIVLTPDHVVLNWARPSVRLPWTSITEIRPVSLRMGRGRGAPSQNYLGVAAHGQGEVNDRMRKLAVRFGPDLVCAVSMRTVDLDQLVVLHTLRFYLDNPRARAELSGPDAVERVMSGRVAGPE